MTTMHDENTSPLAEETPKPKRRLWKIWVPALALILAIGSWFQLAHQQKRSSSNYTFLKNSFNETQSNTSSLAEQITQLKTQVGTQDEQLQALQTNFDRIQSANSSVEIDLALQQVDRYLQQANLNLIFNHDIPGSISLLKAADMRLSSIPNVAVIGLRQEIAHALVQLQAIPNVDYVGVLSKLSALRDQAANLPLFAINTKIKAFKVDASAPVTTKGPLLQDAWHKTLDTLKSLVIIRNRHQEITPLVSPTEEQFLRLNLQLILQQAQWAVLQHQQDVYQFSLTQANEWLQRYFADNDKATTALADDINNLKNVNLQPKTPDISALIDKLHQVQTNFKKAHSNNTDTDVAPTAHTSTTAAVPTPAQQTPVVAIKRPSAVNHTLASEQADDTVNTGDAITDSQEITPQLAKPAKPVPVTGGAV